MERKERRLEWGKAVVTPRAMTIGLERKEWENRLCVESVEEWRGNGIDSRKLAWDGQELLVRE